MNLADLEKQGKILLLKKSEGNATENDLKQLTRILDLISRGEPLVASDMNKRFMEQDDPKDLDFTKS